MVAFADTYKPEAPSRPLSFGYGAAVAVEDDGEVVDGLLFVGRVCAEKQGRATFTGYVADPETGLCYARYRMYSPSLGRFVSRDPMRYIDGYSLYGSYFVPNYNDPLGLGVGGLVKVIIKGGGKVIKVLKMSREQATRMMKRRVQKGKKVKNTFVALMQVGRQLDGVCMILHEHQSRWNPGLPEHARLAG